MGGKNCSWCRMWKSFGEFHNNKASKDGLCSDCKVCRNARKRQWRRDNPEKQNEYNKAWVKNLPPAQKEEFHKVRASKYRDSSRAYYEANRDQYSASNRAWRRAHGGRVLARNHKRRAMQKGVGGSHTDAQWRELCARYGNRCLRCGQPAKLTVDHVRPLSAGGSNDITNIQCLCGPCNCSKKDRWIDYRPA